MNHIHTIGHITCSHNSDTYKRLGKLRRLIPRCELCQRRSWSRPHSRTCSRRYDNRQYTDHPRNSIKCTYWRIPSPTCQEHHWKWHRRRSVKWTCDKRRRNKWVFEPPVHVLLRWIGLLAESYPAKRLGCIRRILFTSVHQRL